MSSAEGDATGSDQPRKVIVLGIPYNAGSAELREVLTQFGTVNDAYIMRDKMTRRSRGFGFVEFESPESANAAIQASAQGKLALGGRDLDVQVAPEKGGAERVQRAQERASARLFVGRIPDAVTDADVRAYFSEFGALDDCFIPRRGGDPKAPHKGYAFVSFEDPASARRVHERPSHSLGGQEIVVSQAVPKGGAPTQPQPRFQQPPHPHGAPMGAHAFAPAAGYAPAVAYGGLHPGFAAANYGQPVPGAPHTQFGHPVGAVPQAPGAGPGQSKRVFVGKIGFQTSESTIRAFFQGLGPVEDVYVPMDRASGQNRGFAFVTFANAATASAAIAQGTFALDGRWVVVSSAWQRGERAAQGPGRQEAAMHAGAGHPGQHPMMPPPPGGAPMGAVPPGQGVPASAGMAYPSLGPGQQQAPVPGSPHHHQQQQQQQYHQQYHAAQAQAQAHAQAQAQAQAAMAQAQQLYGSGGSGNQAWRDRGQ